MANLFTSADTILSPYSHHSLSDMLGKRGVSGQLFSWLQSMFSPLDANKS